MAKKQEELRKLKEEYKTLNDKLKELSSDELEEVTGGEWFNILNNIGSGTSPSLKSSETVSPEEILGGKIPVIPTNNNIK